MEKLIDELRLLSKNNKEMKIYFSIQYDNILDKWGLGIGSKYSFISIYYEFGEDLKKILKKGIEELKKFIEEFEWME